MHAEDAVDGPGRTIPDPPTEAPESNEISLVDILRTVYRHRLLIAVVTGVGIVLGSVQAYLSPRTYTAQAKILPTTFLTSSDAASMAQLRGAASQLGFSMGSPSANASPLFPQLLASRDLAARILAREYPLQDGTSASLFEYMGIKGSDPERNLQLGALYLRGMLRSTYDIKSGVTTISATFRDPRLAAAVVNGTIEELDRFLQELKTSQAGQKARFVTQRLKEVETQLARGENGLKTFRERNRQIIGSPQLMLEEARLSREVTMNEQVFITLKAQLEIARIDAVRDVPDIAVVEKALPPLYRPRWHRTVMMTTMFFGFVGLLAAFSREYLGGWKRMVSSLQRG